MKSMKLNLTATALATSMALGGVAAVPSAANAEMSATIGVANMYLWRGLNLTPSGAQAHGSLDYSKGGFYLGGWATTETDGHEMDLYLGYGGEIGGFSYDISYWKYLYPEERDDTGLKIDLGDSDYSEYALSAGYGPVTATAYIAAESGADDNYYTVDFAFGKFNLQYGWWDLDAGTVASTPGTDDGSDEYSHFTLSYAPTDELTFAISIADSDLPDTDAASVEDDPLFYVGYSKTFDL